MRLTTHLHLVSRLEISASTPPLTHIISWLAQGQFYFNQSPVVSCEAMIHALRTLISAKSDMTQTGKVAIRSTHTHFRTNTGPTVHYKAYEKLIPALVTSLSNMEASRLENGVLF